MHGLAEKNKRNHCEAYMVSALLGHLLPPGTVNQQFLHVDEGRENLQNVNFTHANRFNEFADENHVVMLRKSKQIKHIQMLDPFNQCDEYLILNSNVCIMHRDWKL